MHIKVFFGSKTSLTLKDNSWILFDLFESLGFLKQIFFLYISFNPILNNELSFNQSN